MNHQFETAAGRGVYTSGSWPKALSYSAPMLVGNFLIKIVLLVEVPGDLSDHGVGVAHKAAAVLQTTKKKKAVQFQMDDVWDSWLIIPKLDYINALAADAGHWWQRGAGKKFQAWAKRVYY